MAKRKSANTTEVQDDLGSDNLGSDNLDSDNTTNIASVSPVVEETAERVEGVFEPPVVDESVFWRDVRVSSKRYLMNSLGEVFSVDHRGFFDHEPTFVRKMDGAWDVLKGSDIRQFKRLTPRMKRDLELDFAALLRHRTQILRKA